MKERLPNRIYFDLTNTCNLHCLHCSVDAGSEKTGLLQIGELYDLLEQTRTMGVNKVVFSGGEPLLRTGAFDVFDRAIELDLEVTVLTNGTLIDESAASFFREKEITVKISLDGAAAPTHDYLRGRGAFGHLMKVFERLMIVPPERKAVHYTLHRHNLGELDDLPPLLEKIGIPNLVLGTVKPSGRASVNKDLLIPPVMIPYVRRKIELIERDPRVHIRRFNSKGWEGFGCPAVCDKFGIGADGRATTCVFLGEEYLGGSVRDTPLLQLWRNYLAGGNIFIPNPVCAECPALEATGGGCRARALYFNGDINAPDPYCCAVYHQCRSLEKIRSAEFLQ